MGMRKIPAVGVAYVMGSHHYLVSAAGRFTTSTAAGAAATCVQKDQILGLLLCGHQHVVMPWRSLIPHSGISDSPVGSHFPR